jgi:biotin operon repressor
MLNTLKNLFGKDELVKVKVAKRTETRGRKTLSKKQKVLNLLSKGENVAWKTIQSKFELESPRSMIDTLRAEGYMIFGNRVNGKKYYRMGTPTRAIIAAGIQSLYGTKFKYNNHKVSVKKSELAPIDA